MFDFSGPFQIVTQIQFAYSRDPSVLKPTSVNHSNSKALRKTYILNYT